MAYDKSKNVEVFITGADFTGDLEELFDSFTGNVSKALIRAVNRTASSTRTGIIRKIRDQYKVKEKSVRGRIKLRKTWGEPYSAEIQVTNKPISLYSFGIPRPTKKRPPKGLSVEIRKGSKTLYEGSFFMRAGGKNLIVQRLGSERLPVELVQGPSPAEMVEDSAILEHAEVEAKPMFYRTFRHEIEKGHKYNKGIVKGKRSK